MDLILDGSKIISEEDIHKQLSEGLHFPIWYGRNLDALWDALTGMADRPLKITWINAEQSRKRLPRYEKIVSLLREVEERDKLFEGRDSFTLEIQ